MGSAILPSASILYSVLELIPKILATCALLYKLVRSLFLAMLEFDVTTAYLMNST
jgi:hypothetical protein